ncbi:MAG TPA: M1 family aminopeptidase [Gemmatimonadales bacterium]|nr:M1 family aminopeptidase [Gemmatimonadales bacterium]
MRQLALLPLMLAAAPALAAQAAAPVRDVPVVAPVATSVDTVIRQLKALAPVPGTSGEVHGLALRRGTGVFDLTSGKLYPLTPIGGRTIALLFVGSGRFLASPPDPVERGMLATALGHGDSTLDAAFHSAVFVFADSTWEEVSAHAAFAADPVRPDTKPVGNALDVLGGVDRSHYSASLLGALLDGERSGYFYGFVEPDQGPALGLEVDPDLVESESILRKASHTGVYHWMDVLATFPAAGTGASAPKETTRTDAVTDYTMDLDLPESGGSLAFNARADLTVVPDGPMGPWIPLSLYYKLLGDSASTGGHPTAVWKVKDDPTMWVKLDHRLSAGDTARVRVQYHGDLIDRFGDWFLVNPTSDWYPVPTDYRNYATFDLTFHTPQQYPILSVGDRSDSTTEPGHMLRTRWVIHTPIRNAAFNIGVFSESHLTDAGVPPVTFLYSDHAIKYTLANGGSFVVTPDKKERENVGHDIQNALKFFTSVYGGPPVDRFYAGPIPYSEGLAFPGMIDLSMSTFEGGNGSQKGFDQFFRAHEVSHQWWGIGVDYASYRDQWLSEGLATFSGLWFMQVAFHDNKLYFDYLDRYRDDIAAVADAGPVAIGYRTESDAHPSGYQTLVYEKGAWMAHMLRILMLDLRTMSEGQFTQAMQSFYSSYHGGRASTADFQHLFERHLGIPLDWFFKEYYDGTALPAYQTAWKADAQPDGSYTVHLRVTQSGVPADFENYIPVAMDLGGGRVAHLRMHVVGASSTLDVPGMPAQPKAVKFNDLDGVLAASWKSVGW